jgi:copper transport protein
MLTRLVLSGLAYWWLTSPRRHGQRGLTVLVSLVGGVALAATYAVTGHAVAGSNRLLALTSYLVHVSAMSLWLGGLLMLTLVVLRAPEPGLVVRRFSPVAASCVLTLVATGTFQAWRQIGSWAALTGTTYGRELLVKLGLVALALVAAGFSRAWVRGRETPVRVSIAAEVLLGIAVLVVTSTLVATEPARTAYHSAATAVTPSHAMP